MNSNGAATSIEPSAELPARSNPQATLDWIFSFMPPLGYCPEAAARGYSTDEWRMDLARIEKMADRLGLSDAQFDDLAKRAQDRNKSIWREYSIFS